MLLAFYWDSVCVDLCVLCWLTALVVPGANGRSEASLPSEDCVTAGEVSDTTLTFASNAVIIVQTHVYSFYDSFK